MKTDSPKWRPDYWTEYLQPLWVRVNDIYTGLHTPDLKKRYLRQQMGEHDKVYKVRVDTVAFENRVSPSVKSHAGLLSEFEIDDDAPQTITEYEDDVDGQGNSLYTWSLNWDVNALLYNASLCLVDVPKINDEQDARRERHPRLVQIPLKDVFAPRVAMINGRYLIDQISIRRTYKDTEGFGYKTKERFWVYSLKELDTPIRRGGMLQYHAAVFQTWEQVDDTEDYIATDDETFIRDASGQPLEEIPIVWYSPYGDPLLFSGVDNDDDRGGTPEYMPLVDLNIEYFNKHSELNTAESRGNFVMWMLSYPGPAPDVIPDLFLPGRIAVTENGATLGMLEPEGTAIESTAKGQDRRLTRMDAISQSFLTGGEAERTATEAVIESSQSRLGLRNIARRKESAMQTVFYWWERFANPQFMPGGKVGGVTVSESVPIMRVRKLAMA